MICTSITDKHLHDSKKDRVSSELRSMYIVLGLKVPVQNSRTMFSTPNERASLQVVLHFIVGVVLQGVRQEKAIHFEC